MYKIILVDDEAWVRRGLIQQIDWVGYNAEFIGEASDGEEAYRLAMELKPDIIITDIKMPIMDGIQLMELVNRDLPETKVIVISGYSEFELVQKAMVYKAINYILKPIGEKDLNQVISHAIYELEKDRIDKEERNNTKIILSQSLPALKEKYMNMMISDKGINRSRFDKILSHLKIEFNYDLYQIAAIGIPDYNKLMTDDFNNDDYLLGLSIGDIINESCMGYSNLISFKNLTNSSEHLILLGYPDANTQEKTITEVRDLLLRIYDNLRSSLAVKIIIGVGRIYEKVENIPYSYYESAHAVKYLKSQNSDGIQYSISMGKKDLKDNIQEKVIDYINSHYSEQITLESIAEKFFINPSYLSRVFKNESGEKFIDYVTRIRIEKAGKLMLNPNIKTYEIAEMVGYENTSYFSKIFKKLVGLSPTEFREKLLQDSV